MAEGNIYLVFYDEPELIYELRIAPAVLCPDLFVLNR